MCSIGWHGMVINSARTITCRCKLKAPSLRKSRKKETASRNMGFIWNFLKISDKKKTFTPGIATQLFLSLFTNIGCINCVNSHLKFLPISIVFGTFVMTSWTKFSSCLTSETTVYGWKKFRSQPNFFLKVGNKLST